MATQYCLLGFEIFDFSGKDIGNLKFESKQSPRYFYKVMPEYCLNEKTGLIRRTEEYLQWIESGEERYTLFNILHQGNPIEHEIEGVGIEDTFKGIDLRPWFAKLEKIKYEQWFRRSFDLGYLVMSVCYNGGHDHYSGCWELDSVDVDVVGYLDKYMVQRDLEDNLVERKPKLEPEEKW